MHTELDELLSKAFETEGKQEEVNPFYAAFLRTPLYLPVEKEWQATEERPFKPLMTEVNSNIFLLVFDTLARFQLWVGEYEQQIKYVEIFGRELVDALGNQVYLGLNYGTNFYKEFSPQEIARLKVVVAKTKPPVKQ